MASDSEKILIQGYFVCLHFDNQGDPSRTRQAALAPDEPHTDYPAA